MKVGPAARDHGSQNTAFRLSNYLVSINKLYLGGEQEADFCFHIFFTASVNSKKLKKNPLIVKLIILKYKL